MEVLRGLAERGAQAESKLADVEREMAVLSDQFKKETALRKKYKNERPNQHWQDLKNIFWTIPIGTCEESGSLLYESTF
jgi:type VI protein secretion system component VasK